jgi:hypothetical protein
VDTDPIHRIETKLDKQSWYLRCLHAWLTAGPHVNRAAVRARLEEAAQRLAPAGERLPVVSDPNGGAPEPMT